jgi:hypothetical protein
LGFAILEAERIPMHDAHQNLTTIIHNFGARPATTDSEARLREYLRRRLQERG